ncbi:hypothetical protein [Pseudomonas sp. NMI795_08]|uniref:hypothetical protein n=1 Tax=Pseudomonas sp. NMI795_08 TaxID=2903144 RepID=UPI001E4BDB3A|nr:hypothetical protein [Pseudomonas sp. NMI795_08]MCE1119101.1 hypothetical protein [Pseudomonas sp. NMI795_08]
MADFTDEQRRIISRLDRAFKDAAKAGLALRVFDGAVLMLPKDALSDPRYGEFGIEGAAWIEDCTQRIAIGLNADGGAGR